VCETGEKFPRIIRQDAEICPVYNVLVKLSAGKLPAELLRSLLMSLPVGGPQVVVGPGIGEDATVIDLGGPELLVAKTDPVTFAGEDAGLYLLAVNCNDLATTGAEPRWLLVTALLPVGIEHEQVVKIFSSLGRACTELGVTLVGGHTEMTVGLDHPILVGCLLGVAPRDRVVRTANARAGDAIILAGGIAVEGSAILAREHRDILLAKGVNQEVINRAAAWLQKPGISILPAARIAMASCDVHAMHDPTEGGLTTALHEIAEAANVGLRIDGSAIPLLPECKRICEALELDPLGLLASGALLLCVDSGDAQRLVERLNEGGIAAARIGEAVGRTEGRILLRDGRPSPLPQFARDELARYLETLRGSNLTMEVDDAR